MIATTSPHAVKYIHISSTDDAADPQKRGWSLIHFIPGRRHGQRAPKPCFFQ